MSLMHFNKVVLFSYKPALKKLERMEDSAKEDTGESPLYLVPHRISNIIPIGYSVSKYQSILINLLSDYISNKVLKPSRICS